jgi:hypothetical protein
MTARRFITRRCTVLAVHVSKCSRAKDADYTECNRRNVRDFVKVFLSSNYADITQNTLSKTQWLRRYWPEKFETLTAITHLMITIYILKLAGICGFCNVKICT